MGEKQRVPDDDTVLLVVQPDDGMVLLVVQPDDDTVLRVVHADDGKMAAGDNNRRVYLP
jgi:outer membrane lipoprotein SlyB